MKYVNMPTPDMRIKNCDGTIRERYWNEETSSKQNEQLNQVIEALIDLTIDCINNKYNELHPRYNKNRSDDWIYKRAMAYFQAEISTLVDITGKSWEKLNK